MRLKPITLLAGPNSSGKSSILSAIGMVLQSTSADFPLSATLNGPYARLGEFRNVVKGHSERNSFSVSITVSVDSELIELEGVYRSNSETGGVSAKRVVWRDDGDSVEIFWNQRRQAYFLSYEKKKSNREPFDIVFGDTLHFLHDRSKGGNLRTIESIWRDASNESNLSVKQITAFLNSQINELEKGSVRIEGAKINDAVVNTENLLPVRSARERINRKFRSFLRRVSFVGPVRAHPLRYYASNSAMLDVDPIGESVAQRLAHWRDSDKKKFASVKEALVELELATEIEAKRSLGEFYQLSVRPQVSGSAETIADVGFGVSQILPVIVNDVALGDAGVLAVNQPEVHLHPSSQALLGNYFASRCKSRQYIIETHSEYLITRLRILVAKGVIDSDDVAIFYVGGESSSDDPLISEVKIDDRGMLVDAPDDFFRTYVADTYELAMQGFDDE